MKKNYNQPQIQLTQMEAQQMIAESPAMHNKYSTAEQLSNRNDWNDTDIWGN